jgi:hypothetical protein
MEKMSKLERLIGGLRPSRDYSLWTIEELRQFAQQLRVRDAGSKSRRELVALFETH